MTKYRSYTLVLLTALLWGSSFAVGKLLLVNLNNFQVTFFTITIAWITLAITVALQGKSKVIKKYKSTDYLIFAAMGFLGIFAYLFLFYSGLQHLLAQTLASIDYAWPIMTIIFASIILREKLTARKIIGIVCSFVGVVIVITRGDLSSLRFTSATGVAYALAAAVVYGLFSVLGKSLKYEAVTSMMFYYFFAAIYSLIAVLIFSSIPPVTLYQAAGLIWNGSLASGVAYVLWFLALKYGDTAKMSNMIFLTPFFSLVFGYFLVGERVLLSSLVGLIVIVSGILIQSQSP